MGHEARCSEDLGKRCVADVEAAGIGAEGRHHGALAIAGKTSSLHRAPAGRDTRLGMQMAGDLTSCAGRLMAKRDWAESHSSRDRATESGRQRRIMITRNPDPVAPRLQGNQYVAIGN